MINTVLFDIDDTLLDFNKCAEWAIKTAMFEKGVEYSPDMYPVFRSVNDRMWGSLERGELSRDDIFDRRFAEIFALLGLTLDGRAFEERFLELLHESTEEIPDARELLSYLHTKNYRIYAVSNAMQVQQVTRLEKSGFMKYFDGVFTSELLGASKPSGEFFDRFFSSVPDLTKDEVILIGDSLSADVVGGQSYGLKTCWFNKNKTEIPEGTVSDYIVDSLSEIKIFL